MRGRGGSGGQAGGGDQDEGDHSVFHALRTHPEARPDDPKQAAREGQGPKASKGY